MSAAPPLSLDVPELLRQSSVLVCCGSGGVGKTTSAAALGVRAAQLGRRVQVMTIDPARRLAQALGLEALDFEPQPIVLEAPGSLSAMMLDSKRAFDRMVENSAPSERVRDAIFANQYYQQLSTALGGSRELVAMERVLEIVRAGDSDLLIVDTPPSQHALDFLDAPERIVNLLDGSITNALIRPYGLAARAQFNLFRQSSAATLKFMERLTGVQMLADLSDFLLAFSGLFDGFRERSHDVQALMRQPGTAFLLVCAPEPVSLGQVDLFHQRLTGERMRVAGVLANRVRPYPEAWPGPDQALEGVGLSDQEAELVEACWDRTFSGVPLSQRLLAGYREAAALAAADRSALAGLGRRGLAVHQVPEFTRDLHSMADLLAFATLLDAPGA
ncbi:MAG: ArsA-related P-loop ATPase [Pseudomonadales bacterium]